MPGGGRCDDQPGLPGLGDDRVGCGDDFRTIYASAGWDVTVPPDEINVPRTRP